MKTLTTLFLGAVFFTLASFAGKEIKTIEIKTSAVCDQCKEKIERELVFEKGVKSVKVDLSTKTVTVKYRVDKIQPNAIKKALSKMGYKADEIPGEEEGFNKLPECCKAEGCGK